MKDKAPEKPPSEPDPGVTTCPRHPGQLPEWLCSSCGTGWCNECVIHKNLGKVVVHICPDDTCRGRCMKATMDPLTGRPAEAAPEKAQYSRIPRRSVKHYLTRYWLALAVPSFTLIVTTMFGMIQGGPFLWWTYVIWVALVFLMSARNFWPYVLVSCFCAFKAFMSLTGILSQEYGMGHPLINKISLGLWCLSLVILAVSWSEFNE